MTRRSKYGAVPTVVDGIRFASKAEAKRYGELKLLERAGEVVGMLRQPRFKLSVEGALICTYVGDFLYREAASNRFVCEDTKGFETPDFKIKWKLAQALRPDIDWRLIKSGRGTQRIAA